MMRTILCGKRCVIIAGGELLTQNPLRRMRVNLALAQARVATKFGVTPQKLNAIEHDRLRDEPLEARLFEYYETVSIERAIAKGVIDR